MTNENREYIQFIMPADMVRGREMQARLPFEQVVFQINKHQSTSEAPPKPFSQTLRELRRNPGGGEKGGH